MWGKEASHRIALCPKCLVEYFDANHEGGAVDAYKVEDEVAVAVGHSVAVTHYRSVEGSGGA